jgi:hypothetical protein
MQTQSLKTYTLRQKKTVTPQALSHANLPEPGQALSKSTQDSKKVVELPKAITRLLEQNKTTLKKSSKPSGALSSKTVKALNHLINPMDRIVLGKRYSSQDTYEIIQQEDHAIARYIANDRDPHFKIRTARLLRDL